MLFIALFLTIGILLLVRNRYVYNKTYPKQKKRKRVNPARLHFLAFDLAVGNDGNDAVYQISIAVVRQNEIVACRSWRLRQSANDQAAEQQFGSGPSEKPTESAHSFTKVWQEEIEPAIQEYGILAVHQAHAAIGLLENQLLAHHLELPDCLVLDACIAARQTWPQLAHHSLSVLAAYLHFAISPQSTESKAAATARILLAANATAPNNVFPMSLHHVREKELYDVFYQGR